MIKIFNPVSLDVARSNEFAVVLAKQGDQNSRFITATVNLNGNKVIVPADSRVRLNVIRADGAGASFSGYILDDGRITVPLDRWVTSVAGDSKCSVEITHGMQVLTTMRFIVRTEESEDVRDLDDPDIFPTDPEYDAVLALLDDYTNGRLGATEVFVRYSEYPDGTDCTAVWKEGQKYIGFAAGREAPLNKEGYVWSRFVGEVSANGLELAQEEGDSEELAMSQKAVTDALVKREIASVALVRPAIKAQKYLALVNGSTGMTVEAAYPVCGKNDGATGRIMPALLRWCGAPSVTVYTAVNEKRNVIEVNRVGSRISVYWDAMGGTPTTELYYDDGSDVAILAHTAGETVKIYLVILDADGNTVSERVINDFDTVALLDPSALPEDCTVQKNDLYRITFRGGETKDFETAVHVSSFDFNGCGLPVVYFNGDFTGISKDDKVTVEYIYGERSGTCSLKWQGTSSLLFPKKNYTVVFDEAFEAADGWGEQSKYCLKADWVDFSHARNVVSAGLWGDVVATRAASYIADRLKALPNGGAIDGFPCFVVINGEWQGIYNLDIPKEGWMMGMGEGEKEAIVCAEGRCDATLMKTEATIGTEFELEYSSDGFSSDEVQESLNRLITACKNSDGSDIDTVIAQYVDIDSVIDYMIFSKLICHWDGIGKNYLICTYDGTKWFFSAYDMDLTYGLYYPGTTFDRVDRDEWVGSHQLFILLWKHKFERIMERYEEIVGGVMSRAEVEKRFRDYGANIPLAAYVAEAELWKTVPSTSVSGIDQIITWYDARLDYVKNEFENELSQYGSKGIAYEKSGSAVFCVGMGTCADKDVVISRSEMGTTVNQIRSNAFDGARKMESLTLPDSIQNIQSYAFARCVLLESIVFPRSSYVISYGAFTGCSSLKVADIRTARDIGGSSFSNCTSLEKIYLSAELPLINANTFLNCSSLKQIVYGGTMEQWNALQKGTDWDKGTGNYTVHCTDGDVAKA